MSGERSSKTTSQHSWEADDDGGMVNPSGPQDPVIHREDEIEEQQDEVEEEEDFEEEEDDEVSGTQSQPVGVEEVQVTSPDESRCQHCCHKVIRGIRGNEQIVFYLSLFYLILLRIEVLLMENLKIMQDITEIFISLFFDITVSQFLKILHEYLRVNKLKC